MNLLREKMRLLPLGTPQLGGGGGGGPTQTSSTVQNTNIPQYAQPYVETMLGATQKQLFNTQQTQTGTDAEGNPIYGTEITGFKPYQAYGGTYDAQGNPVLGPDGKPLYDASKAVAGFQPMQEAAQRGIAGMALPAEQYRMAQLGAEAAGRGGLDSATKAYGYGAAGQQAGLTGQQLGIAGGNLGIQGGAQYGNMGVQSGLAGQQLGIAGGGKYGEMGAQAGQSATKLANPALGYGALGSAIGQEATGLVNPALTYGAQSSAIGSMGLGALGEGADVSNKAEAIARQQAMAGQQYARQATNPYAMGAYMSPYMQNVVDVQNREAQRQADIAGNVRGAQAARAGAFGGSRQAIENAEANRALAMIKNQNQAQGLQQAYQQAQQAQQFGANLGLQGQSAAQQGLGVSLAGTQTGLQGLGTALQGQQGALAGIGQAGNMYGLGIQGAQTGLQGVNAANQAYQTGIQGALAGLAGVDRQLAGTAQGMQGAQVGLQGVDRQLAGVDRQLAGTAQGMQGAQIGLQGVQGAQAGYGLTNQSAANLTSMLGQQQQNQLGIYGAQNAAGAQQQALEQAKINQAMLDYANAQQYPLMQLGTMSNMLRGLPMQASTTNQYAASPNPLSQAVGTIGAGASIYNAMRPGGAEGGLPSEFKYAKGGITSVPRYDMGGEVESQLESMDEKGLAEQARTSASPTIRKMAQRLLRERQMSKQPQTPDAANMQYQAAQPQMPSYKPGGIVAFQTGGGANEEGGEAEAKATDMSGRTMEERLAMPPSSAPSGIMAAAPVTQVSPAAAAPSPDIAQEAMRQRNLLTAQAARPITDFLKDIQAERETMGVGENKARDEFRAQQMAERANMKDEQERQRNLRMAEFFASWGSTPGPVLVAGMNALKQSIPNIISDEKEAKKARKEADKIIYDIDEATRLEKLGMIDKATALKEKAAQNAEDYNKLLLTYQSHKESTEAHLKASENAAAASIEHARIMAASHGATSKAADKRADETIRYHMQQDALAKKKAVEGIDATIAKEAKDALDYKTAKNMVNLTRGVDKKARENAQAIVDRYETDWKARKNAAKDEYDLAKDQLNEMNAKLGYSKKTESTTTPPPAPAAAAPSVTVGGQTFTRPSNFTDAQWDAYKKSVGAK